jgi:hypothetical protein
MQFEIVSTSGKKLAEFSSVKEAVEFFEPTETKIATTEPAKKKAGWPKGKPRGPKKQKENTETQKMEDLRDSEIDAEIERLEHEIERLKAARLKRARDDITSIPDEPAKKQKKDVGEDPWVLVNRDSSSRSLNQDKRVISLIRAYIANKHVDLHYDLAWKLEEIGVFESKYCNRETWKLKRMSKLTVAQRKRIDSNLMTESDRTEYQQSQGRVYRGNWSLPPKVEAAKKRLETIRLKKEKKEEEEVHFGSEAEYARFVSLRPFG